MLRKVEGWDYKEKNRTKRQVEPMKQCIYNNIIVPFELKAWNSHTKMS